MIDYLVIGFICGFLTTYLLTKKFKKFDGEFIIDKHYENKTTWFLNVDSELEDIPKKKTLRFKVSVKD